MTEPSENPDVKIKPEAGGHDDDHGSHGSVGDSHSAHHDLPADIIPENSLEDGLLFMTAVAVMGALVCLIVYWGSLSWMAPAAAEHGAAETTERAPIK